MTPSLAILSPHLDDAVLSCWHLLDGPDAVSVINVFAGIPAKGTASGWWDASTGQHDPASVVRTRLAEDHKALALVGLQPVNLGFLDDQYRRVEQPTGSIVAALAAELSPDTAILAPAALTSGATETLHEPHPDHVAVRDAGLALRAAGYRVSLYADLPHASARGWPSWVTGASAPPAPEVAAMWRHALRGIGVDDRHPTPDVRRLAPDEFARKAAAVRRYSSQIDPLERYFGARIDDPALLGYEIVWRLPATAASSSEALSRNRSASA
jgi:LmbE family N-acetylglucosaminyl deacetylase